MLNTKRHCVRLIMTAAVLVAVNAPVAAETVLLTADRDNTLYESATGGTSNGAGFSFFAGRTGQTTNSVRRGLVRFAVEEAIPPGSTVTSVEVRLHVTRAASSLPKSVGLHAVAADWGEGASNAGSGEGGGAAAVSPDATWTRRFHNTVSWAVQGGDYAPGADAATDVSGVGAYTWGSSAGLVGTVQAWVDGQAGNYGWLVKGDESAPRTAKRFETREGAAATRPQLTVTYTPPVVLPVADFTTATVGVGEADGQARLAVSLDKAPGLGASATVDFATSPLTASESADYGAFSGTLHFGAVDTLFFIDVPIVDDGTVEPVETFQVTLSNPVGCTLANVRSPATVTITSNDIPSALVHVDFAHSAGESGTLTHPYNTLEEGLAAVLAGGTVQIAGGISTGTPRITQGVRLTTLSGPVRIGVAPGL